MEGTPPLSLEACSPVDEEADVSHLSTSTESILQPEHATDDSVMALQLSDSLNRTFADLKSKHEDVRLRASYDLHGLVTTAARGKALITHLIHQLTRIQSFHRTISKNSTAVSISALHTS